MRFQRLFAGIIMCTILVVSVGGNQPFLAHAAQGNQQNKGNGVLKEKNVKNNKRNVNGGNITGETWNHEMIQVMPEEESGEVVRVAIIDTGVNYSSDINVVVRKNFIEGDECNLLYEDFSGHGTAVAGLIGAFDNEEGITGVNPGVEIYSARVLDDNLEAPIDRVVDAIDWAIEQKCDIINFSFGVEDNILELEEAIERADAITRNGQSAIRRIKHWSNRDGGYADSTSTIPKRYDAAKQVMKNVLGKAYSSSVGTINDFAFSTYYCGNTDTTRFYLGNLLQYASEAAPTVYNSWVNANNTYIAQYRYLDLQYNCTDYIFD